ncbi:Acid sphingomyelinase-like phosphodiesterase 3b [Homalodisca vitripennis]|nr:Acid sphingomyelinase-like phosphodiesterase 3b [Homalodisca vitripennis]
MFQHVLSRGCSWRRLSAHEGPTVERTILALDSTSLTETLLNSLQVLDYTKYNLNLNQANEKEKSEWVEDYNFVRYYGLMNITPSSLHELASTFRRDSPSFDSLVRIRLQSTYLVLETSLTPPSCTTHPPPTGWLIHDCRFRIRLQSNCIFSLGNELASSFRHDSSSSDRMVES